MSNKEYNEALVYVLCTTETDQTTAELFKQLQQKYHVLPDSQDSEIKSPTIPSSDFVYGGDIQQRSSSAPPQEEHVEENLRCTSKNLNRKRMVHEVVQRLYRHAEERQTIRLRQQSEHQSALLEEARAMEAEESSARRRRALDLRQKNGTSVGQTLEICDKLYLDAAKRRNKIQNTLEQRDHYLNECVKRELLHVNHKPSAEALNNLYLDHERRQLRVKELQQKLDDDAKLQCNQKKSNDGVGFWMDQLPVFERLQRRMMKRTKSFTIADSLPIQLESPPIDEGRRNKMKKGGTKIKSTLDPQHQKKGTPKMMEGGHASRSSSMQFDEVPGALLEDDEVGTRSKSSSHSPHYKQEERSSSDAIEFATDT